MSVATETAPKVDNLPYLADIHTPEPSIPNLSSKQSQEALVARLSELVKAEPVMLFMKGTPKSPFDKWPTFPQLWVYVELVGGLDIVREEFNTKPDYLSEHTVEDDVAFKHGKRIQDFAFEDIWMKFSECFHLALRATVQKNSNTLATMAI
ncbi:hypothetical protein HYE67_011392 [Fusarium culmorum]|uniref:Uncharacterized protein n=1 Tax=Fusarium culmorum TaxID=5516 RepID=A0A2T4GGF8_FUSCU|nr:hypothetical protein FCULG_00009054 [Fusarium culmorum]QPC69161.1 hypothetical protein HYE67_011392 [Fusarium culmorum]